MYQADLCGLRAPIYGGERSLPPGLVSLLIGGSHPTKQAQAACIRGLTRGLDVVFVLGRQHALVSESLDLAARALPVHPGARAHKPNSW